MDKEIIEYANSKGLTCEKVRTGKYMFYGNGLQFVNRPIYCDRKYDIINNIKDQIDLVYYNVKCDSETTQEDTPTV